MVSIVFPVMWNGLGLYISALFVVRFEGMTPKIAIRIL